MDISSIIDRYFDSIVKRKELHDKIATRRVLIEKVIYEQNGRSRYRSFEKELASFITQL
jgi:hypothetical protein